MPPSTSFTIGRSGDMEPTEFCLLERCRHDYGSIDSVRRTLEAHRQSLLMRIEALDAILGSDEPERAERLLLDATALQVDEVTLRAPRTQERFDAIMRDLWKSGE